MPGLNPTVPKTDPQYGDAIKREQITQAVPLPVSPSGATPTPQPPQAPGAGTAAGAPDEAEFQSPFSLIDLPYDKQKLLFLAQVMGNMATDERSTPDLKEMYWALKQDLDNDGVSDNTQTNGQPPQNNQSTTNENKSDSEMVALLKEIRDRLPENSKKP